MLPPTPPEEMSLADKVRYLLRGLQPSADSAVAALEAVRPEEVAVRGAAYEALRGRLPASRAQVPILVADRDGAVALPEQGE